MKAVRCLVVLAISVLAFAEDPKVGLLKNGDVYELTVLFPAAVEPNSAQDLENYHASAGEFIASKLNATNQAVTLTTTGLAEGVTAFLNITNVFDTSLQPFPDAHVDFFVTNRFWTTIGANELSLPPNAYAVGTNGFDIFSGGIQQSDDYDEATFAGELITGDFDRKVRVEWIDPAGRRAKAGLMVRESMDTGKERPLNPDDVEQGFSRYIELAISAPQTVQGQAGNPAHQIWMRPTNAAQFTLSLTVTNDATPTFPDAWLRIQRIGNEFRCFRGTNGIKWEQLGSAQFPTPAPDTVNVGAAFSPQNDDIASGSGFRQSFAAKFREYGGTNSSSSKLVIEQLTPSQAELSWTGTGILQSASPLPATTSGWSDTANQNNPQTIPLTDSPRFYRLRSPN